MSYPNVTTEYILDIPIIVQPTGLDNPKDIPIVATIEAADTPISKLPLT